MGYISEPLSRQMIRNLAVEIRKRLGLFMTEYMPVVWILENLHHFDPDAHFEIVQKEELEEGEHAVTEPLTRTIKIREDVYENACNGVGRDRMTIAHELAHFMLICLLGVKLARTFDNDIPPYRDPEWQAKCLAGELMMPVHIIEGRTPEDIAILCGVSVEAARFQLSTIEHKQKKFMQRRY